MAPNKAHMRRCHEGKRRFSTLREAQAAAAGMAKRKDKQGNTIVTFLRAYGCACGGYHFGKTKEINWALVK